MTTTREKNVWTKFDVRREAAKSQTQRRRLLNESDRILFDNDPNRTPKRVRDGKIDHALSATPKPKHDGATLQGHVEVPYRQIVHELFAEDTNDLDELFRNIGVETLPKTPKKWGTPLSRHTVDKMTIDEIDENHKRLQVQIDADYATGMARKNGDRVVNQLIAEDRKRAEEKIVRDKWLEHRRRLKNVAQPKVIEHSKKKNNKNSKNSKNINASVVDQMDPKRRRNQPSSWSSSSSSSRKQPVTMLGADESKPIYGMRAVDDIDEIIAKSKKKGVLMDLDPSVDIISRCAKIRKHSQEDLMTLHNGLNIFLQDELLWEEKRHDIKYVLNSKFDMLKKEIDHSVTVGGADYKYDESFKLNDDDRRALQRIRSSVKSRRKKALQTAETVREETRRHMMERTIEEKRRRLGLRPRKGVFLRTGSDYDQAAANILEPKTGGVHSRK